MLEEDKVNMKERLSVSETMVSQPVLPSVTIQIIISHSYKLCSMLNCALNWRPPFNWSPQTH